MGFSLIAAAVVLGIATAMAFNIFTTAVFPTVTDINTAYQDLNQRLDTTSHANIQITTITQTPNATSYDYTITIHNTGTITLPTQTMTVLIDGTQHPFTTTTHYLYPDTATTLTLTNIPGAAPRVKVITDHAIAAYSTYTP